MINKPYLWIVLLWMLLRASYHNSYYQTQGVNRKYNGKTSIKRFFSYFLYNFFAIKLLVPLESLDLADQHC